jgi:hypothetical protein
MYLPTPEGLEAKPNAVLLPKPGSLLLFGALFGGGLVVRSARSRRDRVGLAG